MTNYFNFEQKDQGFGKLAQKNMSMDSKKALEFGINQGFENRIRPSYVQPNVPKNAKLNVLKNAELNVPNNVQLNVLKNVQLNVPKNNPITRSINHLTNQGNPQDFMNRLVDMQNIEDFTKMHSKLRTNASMDFVDIRSNPHN